MCDAYATFPNRRLPDIRVSCAEASRHGFHQESLCQTPLCRTRLDTPTLYSWWWWAAALWQLSRVLPMMAEQQLQWLGSIVLTATCSHGPCHASGVYCMQTMIVGLSAKHLRHVVANKVGGWTSLSLLIPKWDAELATVQALVQGVIPSSIVCLSIVLSDQLMADLSYGRKAEE